MYGVALSLAMLGLASLLYHIGLAGRVTDRQWIVAEIDNGNVRLGYAYRADRMYTQHLTYVRLGFLGRLVLANGTWQGKWRYLGVTMPLWTVVALLFVHPGVAYVCGPLRRRRRQRRNQCVNCGYERVGNTSGICPECGNRLTCPACAHELTGSTLGICPVCGSRFNALGAV